MLSVQDHLKTAAIKKKKNFKTLWPLFMDGVQLPQGYSHFEEAVYFLPLRLQASNTDLPKTINQTDMTWFQNNLDHTDILRWTLKININIFVKKVNDFRPFKTLSNIYSATINTAHEIRICFSLLLKETKNSKQIYLGLLQNKIIYEMNWNIYIMMLLFTLFLPSIKARAVVLANLFNWVLAVCTNITLYLYLLSSNCTIINNLKQDMIHLHLHADMMHLQL